MEESKEQQKIHTLFRSVVYISVILEILVYVQFPFSHHIDFIISRIGKWAIYDNLVYSKLATLLLLLITCIGTRAKKNINYNVSRMITIPFITGLILLIISVWLYIHVVNFKLFTIPATWVLYIIFSLVGIICVNVALDNISKILKSNLMKDKWNFENESFEQETKLIENDHSVNIPMKFYYKGKMNDGYINIENVYRGLWIVGPPGSGKTFSIIEPYIRQLSTKGFMMVVYDYKFPTLGRKLFYLFEKNKKLGIIPDSCTFNVINFTDVEHSRRVNPIQKKYIKSSGAATETASVFIESLQKGKKEGGGGSDDFFKTAAENLLAAVIWFFIRYENGKYSDLPHVLSFLMQEYVTIFNVLQTDELVAPLLEPFRTALKNKAMDQLEGMAGTLRIYISRLASPESYWIFSGDDFDLKVSDPRNPSYLLIANDPEMEGINSSLNALILNRLVTCVNSGEGKNIPVSIVIDELPTLFFNKIDRLLGTARSNKVAIGLGFQEKDQIEKDYGKLDAGAIMHICANVICASARSKETLEWLQNEIFGKVKQIKEGVSIADDKTTISLNENMDYLVPASKIADMSTGWLCGQTARDFKETKTDKAGNIDIEKSDEFKTTKFFCKTNFDIKQIKNEEKKHVDLPIFYNFGSSENKDKILLANYQRINREVKELITNILGNSL